MLQALLNQQGKARRGVTSVASQKDGFHGSVGQQRCEQQMVARWWQLKYFLMFTPKIGEDEPLLTNIFQMGWFNHQRGGRLGSIPGTLED